MLGVLFGLLEHSLVGICLASMSLVLFSLAILIRQTPHLAGFLRLCLRWILILSYRFYHLILVQVSRGAKPRLGIDVFSGFARILACLFLSLILGSLFSLITNLPFAMVVGLAILHGLVVGLAWDDTERPNGFQLGARVE